MTHELSDTFGSLLTHAREAAGLSRVMLAERVGLAASYVYRIEVGDRRPSREVLLALAETLKVESSVVEEWLLSVGYSAMPLLPMVRRSVRTRGAISRSRTAGTPASSDPPPSDWDAGRWATCLETMGIREPMIRRLLKAMDTATAPEHHEVARAMSTAFDRVADRLESPVHTAIIPAAGGQHRLLATHVTQRLLLRAIGEAARAGISRIILVLSPGTVESLYTPLAEALALSVVPALELLHVEQTTPEGLGDAVLQAEEQIGSQPFAVLLPDDVVFERVGRVANPAQLAQMIDAFQQLDTASLVAVTPVPKSKMAHCGVVSVNSKELMPRVCFIRRLVERPEAADPIHRATRTFGIVGRYLLQPLVFERLREMKQRKNCRLELTDALEQLRQAGANVCAYELEASRHDVGEVIGRASAELIDNFAHG